MTKRIQKPMTHGGARKGAGAKPKDPANRRTMWSGRLHPDTTERLRLLVEWDASVRGRSQGQFIDEAIAYLCAELDIKCHKS